MKQEQEKNYYIVLPITLQNIQNAYSFIETEHKNFKNVGDNCVCLIVPNPNNPMLPSYQIELKESLVDFYRTTLEGLNAEFYESAEAYLIAYPPIENENFI
jgi:hypothetical protein